MSSTTTAVKEVRTIAITFGQMAALVVVAFIAGAIFMMKGTEKPANASPTVPAVSSPATVVADSPKAP